MKKFFIHSNEDTIAIGMTEFDDNTSVDVDINGNIVCCFNIGDNGKVHLMLYGIDEDDDIEIDGRHIKIERN